MIEYPKIQGPFRRNVDGPDRNKVIIGDWTRPEFDLLANTQWEWTEKIDGTNIRIGWDGHKVSIGGRTDNAQLHADLVRYLTDTFTEELFEQEFGSDSVILFGEGCGPGIQKGGDRYGDHKHFKLFDVKVGDWWLLREDVMDVADKLGIEATPVVLTGDVSDAINLVTDGVASFYDGNIAEGVVGVPVGSFCDRAGRRIQMKVKSADFHEAA